MGNKSARNKRTQKNEISQDDEETLVTQLVDTEVDKLSRSVYNSISKATGKKTEISVEAAKKLRENVRMSVIEERKEQRKKERLEQESLRAEQRRQEDLALSAAARAGNQCDVRNDATGIDFAKVGA